MSTADCPPTLEADRVGSVLISEAQIRERVRELGGDRGRLPGQAADDRRRPDRQPDPPGRPDPPDPDSACGRAVAGQQLQGGDDRRHAGRQRDLRPRRRRPRRPARWTTSSTPATPSRPWSSHLRREGGAQRPDSRPAPQGRPPGGPHRARLLRLHDPRRLRRRLRPRLQRRLPPPAVRRRLA